jgi:hypothetical protein
MKKLFLSILVLGFLFGGVAKSASKLDEFQCYHSDGSGSEYFAITNNHIIMGYMTTFEKEIKIMQNTNERVVAEDDLGIKKITFYKRTKKILLQYGITESFLYSCTKLN